MNGEKIKEPGIRITPESTKSKMALQYLSSILITTYVVQEGENINQKPLLR